MALNEYNFENLHNEAETLILNELEHQIKIYTAPLCRCNDCIVDIAAMALNSVKPLYRVSLLGSLYTAIAMDEKSYATSIKTAVKIAIEKVRKNPSHDIIAEDAEKN